MKSFLNYLNESILLEDKEGKMKSRADKWINDNGFTEKFKGQKLNDKTINNSRDILNAVQSDIKAITLPYVLKNGQKIQGGNGWYKGEYKYALGILRIYLKELPQSTKGENSENELIKQVGRLNDIVEYIANYKNSDFKDDKDGWDLNGLTLDELEQKYGREVDELKKKQKEDAQKNVGNLKKNERYTIIPIESYKQAHEYSGYVSWCVTHDNGHYNRYTNNGVNKFYFVLRDDYKTISKDDPDYAVSMLAIMVDDKGDIRSTDGCTSRLNNNGSFMTVDEIQKLLGVDFYKTFLPWSVKDLWQKYEKIKKGDDDFCKFFGCIKIDNEEGGIIEYKKLIDDKIQTLIKIDDKTAFVDNKFVTLKDGKFVEGKPTSIGDLTFVGCKSLKEITIPDSVTHIGGGAFVGCKSLKEITIPDSVTYIGGGAFSECTSLTSITIPDSVTSIDINVFYDCASLTSITIPNSVTSIGDAAFAYCKSLKEITIPDSVTSIGDAAFAYCKSLNSIYVKGDIEKVKEVFEENNKDKVHLLKPLSINESINNYIQYWAKLIKENQ